VGGGVKPVEELRELVEGLGAHPELWASDVRHAADERVCVSLARTDEVEVWLICWLEGHDTGFHDHDDAAAAITVVAGAVRDERLSLGGAPLATTHGPGETFTVDPGGIHRVRHDGDAPAVTIHAYSPPLDRVGTYVTAADGRLLRLPQAGSAALQPAESASAAS
jgi:quercetin dioxygenase-like cupin family protein